MSDTYLSALWRINSALQVAAMGCIAILTIALGLTLGLSLAGLIPGLDLTLTLSDGTAITAGTLLHGAGFLVCLLLLSYMPANWRMRRLEAGHRSFRMGMEDVARAYSAAHSADRAELFSMSSEYDAVRERLEFLAHHPDLGHLEPEILEVAAQMSKVSEDLAATYSDKSVARARAFLAARQDEVTRMEDRIDHALKVGRELKQWHDRVSIDEDVARSRVEQLRAELEEVLPDLGLSPDELSIPSEIVHLSPRSVAAE